MTKLRSEAKKYANFPIKITRTTTRKAICNAFQTLLKQTKPIQVAKPTSQQIMEKANELEKKIPKYFLDPITQEIMLHPVVLVSGHSYEQKSISTWLETKNTDPNTGKELKSKLQIPNYALESAIHTWVKRQLGFDVDEVLRDEKKTTVTKHENSEIGEESVDDNGPETDEEEDDEDEEEGEIVVMLAEQEF